MHADKSKPRRFDLLVILALSKGVNLDLYRYLSLYELYNIVKHKKLKFTKLALMDDLNEGIYMALQSQLPSAFGIEFSNSHDEIVKYHKNIKERNYISCWTTEKDSMAMWLLYSKDKNGFRIRTTKEKLEKHTNKFMENNFWTKHINSNVGTIQTPETESKIKNIDYININDIFKEIKNLHKEERTKIISLYSKILQKEIRKNERKNIKDSIRKKADKIILDPLFLKETVYQFENECRALLRVDMRNKITEKEYKEEKYFNYEDYSISEMDYVMGTATTDFSESRIFPNIIEVDVDDKFIEEICIDPRILKYQQNILKEILGVDDKFVTSKVFSCIVDDIDFSMKYFSDYG